MPKPTSEAAGGAETGQRKNPKTEKPRERAGKTTRHAEKLDLTTEKMETETGIKWEGIEKQMHTLESGIS